VQKRHWFIRCSKTAQKLRIISESCREFHKLSNKYKIAQNGVRSKELWPKYGRAYGSTG
jgi:hypothetical protein